MKKQIVFLLSLCISVMMQAQVSKTIVCSAGNLSIALTSNEKTTVTNLTITGTIDARDFLTMRDTLSALSVIDLSGATIVAYTGTQGTGGTSSIAYSANSVSQYAFCGFPSYTGKASLTSVTIPNSTLSIGNYAFYSCSGLSSITLNSLLTSLGDDVFAMTGLTSVTIPSNVTSIGNGLFTSCASLKTVSIHSPITTIGTYMFDGCTSLTSFTIPQTVTTINGLAFAGSGLTTLTIPSLVTVIGSGAFQNCTSLKTVSNLSSLTTIQNSLFEGCSSLTSFDIPTTVTTISSSAFSGCTSLLTASIPALVTSIGSSAFLNCSSLSTVTFINSLTSIGNYAFSNCSALTSMTIPSSVSTIGTYAFNNCSSLTSITIPSGVKTIGTYTFSGCTNLASVDIPITVTLIDSYAFNNCSSLVSITIPPSVTTIGASAFSSCSKLLSITVYTATPVTISQSANVFLNVNKSTCVLHIPANATSSYHAANQWLDFTNVIEMPSMNTKSVTCSAGSLTTLLTPLQKYIIANLTILGTIDARDFKTMRDSMPMLSQIDIANAMIAEYTGTLGTAGTTSTLYPTNYIPQFAFCIPSTFVGKTSLMSITPPSSISKIDDNAFYNCSQLNTISLSEGLLSIGLNSFRGCSALTSINIPSTVSSIGNQAFYSCAALFSVSDNNASYSSLNGVLFDKSQEILQQCPISKAGSYSIPSSVTSISDNAFYGCVGLISLTIPTSVTSIGTSAFSGCTGLSSITALPIVPVNLQISTNVFLNVNKSTCILNVSSGCKGAYSSATQWKDFTNIIQPVSSKTVSCTAGNLSLYLSIQERTSITNITITGTIDARDFKTMRDSLPALSVIDLSGTTVSAYTGTYGTGSSASTMYAVNTIPIKAFLGKSSLLTIINPVSIITIDSYSFSGCIGLSAYSIPTTVKTINDDAFDNCESLTSIIIPTSVTYLGSYIFNDCIGLTSVTLSSSLTELAMGAFYNCTSLASISIPTSIATIWHYAFYNCTSLTGVYISSTINLKYVGDFAFYNCKKVIGGYMLPNSVTYIGTGAFEYCTGLTSFQIPNTLTSLEENIFEGCTSLTSISIPSTVTTIKDWAFTGCIGLTSVTIPTSVTSIGQEAFSGSTSLSSITIPSTVSLVKWYAFSCSGLKSIIATSATPLDFTSYYGIFSEVNKNNCTLYVPVGSKAAYLAAKQWQDFIHIIEGNNFWLSDSTVYFTNTAGTKTVTVNSANAWTVSSDQTWLTVSPTQSTGNNNITFTATANTTGANRSAIVTISANGVASQTIVVTQGVVDPFLSISTTSANLTNLSSSYAIVNVSSNVTWSYSSDQTWLKVFLGTASSVRFYGADNLGQERTATITISATGLPSKTITVTQAANDVSITLETTNTSIAKESGSLAYVYVLSNTTWTASSDQSWLTVNPSSSTGNNTITLVAIANPGAPRVATVTVAANRVAPQTITVTQTSASSTWNGTDSWNQTANWNNTALPQGGSIVVKSGTLTINQNVEVTDLTIAPGAKLTLNNGNSLIVNGNIVIQSDSTGTGSFVDQGTTIVTGTSSVQQYLKSGRNWYISTPVITAQSGVIKSTTGNILWMNDETTQTWNEIANASTALSVMKGYVANVANNGIVTFTGNLNTGTQTVSNLSRTGTSVSNRGFNLIGNPYPSFVNWEMATKTNLEPTIWYRTKNQSNAYVFDSYNADSHIGTNNNGIEAVSQYIPSMQAVWVRVNTDGVTGLLTFNSSMQSHQNSNQLKNEIEKIDIRLTVSNGKNNDETILVFNEHASNSFDQFDSEKMFNTNNDIPELFTLADNEKLVINGMKPIDSSKVIPLGFKTAKVGTYTISASEILGLDGIPVVLEDKQLNVTQDLTEKSSYTFSSDSVNDANRFLIHLKADNETTTSKIEQSSVTIYTKGYTAVVNTSLNNAIGTVAVFNLLGQKVAGCALSGTQTFIQLPMISGTYFVIVSTDTIVKTKKIIVK